MDAYRQKSEFEGEDDDSSDQESEDTIGYGGSKSNDQDTSNISRFSTLVFDAVGEEHGAEEDDGAMVKPLDQSQSGDGGGLQYCRQGAWLHGTHDCRS